MEPRAKSRKLNSPSPLHMDLLQNMSLSPESGGGPPGRAAKDTSMQEPDEAGTQGPSTGAAGRPRRAARNTAIARLLQQDANVEGLDAVIAREEQKNYPRSKRTYESPSKSMTLVQATESVTCRSTPSSVPEQVAVNDEEVESSRKRAPAGDTIVIDSDLSEEKDTRRKKPRRKYGSKPNGSGSRRVAPEESLSGSTWNSHARIASRGSGCG